MGFVSQWSSLPSYPPKPKKNKSDVLFSTNIVQSTCFYLKVRTPTSFKLIASLGWLCPNHKWQANIRRVEKTNNLILEWNLCKFIRQGPGRTPTKFYFETPKNVSGKQSWLAGYWECLDYLFCYVFCFQLLKAFTPPEGIFPVPHWVRIFIDVCSIKCLTFIMAVCCYRPRGPSDCWGWHQSSWLLGHCKLISRVRTAELLFDYASTVLGSSYPALVGNGECNIYQL